MQTKDKHILYNEEEVHFCKNCLSLSIKDLDGVEYCNLCHSTNIDSTDIYLWQDKYKIKYNKEYIKEPKDDDRTRYKRAIIFSIARRINK